MISLGDLVTTAPRSPKNPGCPESSDDCGEGYIISIIRLITNDDLLVAFPYMGLSENRVYSQWNSHLIGIMISKTIGFNGVHYFQTHPYLCLCFLMLGGIIFVACQDRISGARAWTSLVLAAWNTHLQQGLGTARCQCAWSFHGTAETYGNLWKPIENMVQYMFIFDKSIYVHMFLLFNRPLTSINQEFYEGESESLGIPLTPTSAALGDLPPLKHSKTSKLWGCYEGLSPSFNMKFNHQPSLLVVYHWD